MPRNHSQDFYVNELRAIAQADTVISDLIKSTATTIGLEIAADAVDRKECEAILAAASHPGVTVIQGIDDISVIYETIPPAHPEILLQALIAIDSYFSPRANKKQASALQVNTIEITDDKYRAFIFACEEFVKHLQEVNTNLKMQQEIYKFSGNIGALFFHATEYEAQIKQLDCYKDILKLVAMDGRYSRSTAMYMPRNMTSVELEQDKAIVFKNIQTLKQFVRPTTVSDSSSMLDEHRPKFGF